MLARDYRDIACGGLLCLAGIAVAFYSSTSHDLGSFGRMGTGMFPMILGLILVLLGVLIAIPAFQRTGEIKRMAGRPILAVLAALSAFPLLLPRVGFVPTIAATVLLSTLAEDRLSMTGRLVLTAAICGLTYVIFILGFRLPVATFRMPF